MQKAGGGDVEVRGRERRRESREVRREQLIRATLDTIARKGYPGVTLGDVADAAGLSRGIVNFHFASKERLLLETLQFICDDYRRHWRKGLEAAGPDAGDRIEALLLSDLDPDICNERMISAWFAFWAEAANNAAYRELCWSHDEAYESAIESVCRDLKAEAGYGFDPARMGGLVYAMQEGLWLRLMVGGDRSRQEALEIVRSALASLFPGHFDAAGARRGKTAETA